VASAKILQKKSRIDRVITSVLSSDGNFEDKSEDILSEYKEQYSVLFTSAGIDNSAADEFLLENHLGKASPIEQAFLGSKVTCDEIIKV